ncbi:APC family permease [Actinomycetes bacterium M1A6_2h]
MSLQRRLGVGDSVVIGLGAMIASGIFVALGPAAAAAGGGLFVALAVAAVIAYCNASSSARLAAVYPQSGGTYVYGRERLGPFWGYLAGWAFVVGKTASCAAMALTVGNYAWPQHANVVAVVAVLLVTAVDYVGVQKSALLARAILTVVLAVLAMVVILSILGGGASAPSAQSHGVSGVVQGAGLLFFAFAGYARIATLGEEVRDPERTIPRAIPIALAVTFVVYAAVTAAVVHALGIEALAAATNPLAQTVRAAGFGSLEFVVRVGAVVAAVGSLLSLLLGVSRTTFAMARDGHLPRTLAAVHPRFGGPHHAEVAIGIVVAMIAGTVDVRQAIGFSSFAVLTYYLVANASAWTLSGLIRDRVVPLVGATGCVVLALFLPVTPVLVGSAVLVLGALAYFASRVRSR